MKPFKLEPTYRDYVWGGNRLRPEVEKTAEAWVVYEENTIKTGRYTGKTLVEASEVEGKSLLGSVSVNQTGHRFPLLIKLLDCARWLSLQVHPNDEQAKKLEGPGNFGKTEAWYVVDSEVDSELLSGLKEGVTHAQINEAVGNQKILDLVIQRKVRPGDYLFMAPGTIHALGPGLLIYEVQQTSDITYRVYDWDRPMTGRRKLHIEQAIKVLNPEERGDIHHVRTKDGKIIQENLITSNYFSLNLISGTSGEIQMNTHGYSFHALTILEGKASVQGKEWFFTLQPFETILVPAMCREYNISTSNQIRLINSFVPEDLSKIED